jgi:hypothetical protein
MMIIDGQENLSVKIVINDINVHVIQRSQANYNATEN